MTDFVMSDGWGNEEEIEHVTTNMPEMRDQVKVLGEMYNACVARGMTTKKQQIHDGFVHWLAEIVEALEEDGVVVVEVGDE